MEKIELHLDPDDLTLGDLEDFEDAVGKPLDEVIKPVPVFDADGNRVFDDKGRPESTMKIPAKALTAIVWLTQRQKRPGFTLADARNVKVTSLILTDNSAPADPGAEGKD